MYYLLMCLVQHGIVGQNPVTCVTFDDTDCEITATHGVCLSIFGVYAVVCGPDNNKCGVFQEPTRIIIPKFLGQDFDQLSISFWFKQDKDKNAYILTTGRCAHRWVTIWQLTFISLLDDADLCSQSSLPKLWHCVLASRLRHVLFSTLTTPRKSIY